MTVAVSRAKGAGAEAIICASTGNTAASCAAYAARAGLRGRRDRPGGQDRDRQARPGADARRPRDRAARQLRPGARDRPRARRAPPGRARQLGQPVPDRGPEDRRVRGLRRARRATRRARDPGRQRRQHHRLVAGLPGVRGAPGPVRVPGRGRGAAGPRQSGARSRETVASAIRIGNPARWEEAMDAVTASRGRIAAVSDEQILDAYHLLASREGVFCEPASAASVAGILAHGLPAPDGGEPPGVGRLRAHRPRPQGPRHRARQGAVGDRLRGARWRRSSGRSSTSEARTGRVSFKFFHPGSEPDSMGAQRSRRRRTGPVPVRGPRGRRRLGDADAAEPCGRARTASGGSSGWPPLTT